MTSTTLATPPRWEENRDRARRFVTKWTGERRERAEKDSFWNDLLDVFAVDRRQVARFEAVAKRYSTGRTGYIDLFWPGRLLAEHKTAGRSLDAAMVQALDYLPGMDPDDVPGVVVACDFQEFLVHDLDAGSTERFALQDLPDRLELFGLLEGRDRRRYDSDEDVNLAGTGLLAAFHDVLQANGYPDHERRVLLTRVLFCLFADDAGVWPLGLFEDFLRLHTRPDGSDLGGQLAWLFQILDTPPERRGNLPDAMRDFTYVNGGVFAERLSISQCDAAMRNALLACSRFKWTNISPAIFGSMFQNVMTDVERRNLGAHYTTERNILRTIRPLFLDALEAELVRADSRPKLRAFRDKLASLTFFDPACGCGNFLLIAYRELRRLETECLVRLRDLERREQGRGRADTLGQMSMDVSIDSKVGVGQFFGIEIEEFPCRIAETAMHLADHLANQQLSSALGAYYARFPITDTAAITHGNALRLNWNQVLPAASCDYLLGNPPFVGMAWMSPDQQTERNDAFAALAVPGSRTGRLDYVAAWYAKALAYLRDNGSARAAFVSTNSITQGEQARTLGPLLQDSGYGIDFAHRTFSWTSEARGAANVHVVIVGFSRNGAGERSRRLFDYPNIKAEPVETAARNINIYLADAPDVVPAKRDHPLLPGLPPASKGSQPTDGGHLTVEADDYDRVTLDPVAARYLRPYRQSREMLHNLPRWCLWLVDATPAELLASHELRFRLAAVRAARQASPTRSVQEQAGTPALFTQRRQPQGTYLAMPEVSSGNRRYIPAVLYDSEVVAGNKLICWPDADLWLFGTLQSRAFTLWVATVAGRLKSDFSIAPDLTYCTFPFPDPQAGRTRIEDAAQGVLDAREQHPLASLAELYHPLAMPADLVDAHRQLDRAVEQQLAPRRRLTSDGDLLNVLFDRYEQLIAAEQLTGRSTTRRR